ncbi:Bug family tripartite tricarboxylate transporter substrate binding protein [Nesterenkonia flava]|uniref:Tripartite tricarboxylate transporter substrate binding protein n=1 Tax=Nesterenkonia flava TaxID=469799 RepID=A0ABU1FVR9_9MICC|nr:tripartite tricarboxylate transporter substrate binding protein [Nesterenkonia flava]MDR5712768.1 tripartite tricarboxylate transporter substrate binding protein [Nesterenkonia flava]
MSLMRTKAWGSACAASALLVTISACGDASEAAEPQDDFPNENIEMVIPYPPGGGSDVLFRLMAEYASEELPVTITPTNVEGASATVGSRQVKDSDADGYTILASHQVVAAAHHNEIVDYGFDAFEPIALGTTTPHLPSVSTEFSQEHGIEDLQDFLEYVEANPNTVNWGFTTGSEDHYSIAAVLDAAGLDTGILNYVNYDGTGPQYAGLVAGEIQGMTGDYASAEGYIEDGSLLPLGIVAEERDPNLPDLPTVQEQGVDYTLTVDRGFFAPEGTPEEHIEILAEAFEAAINNPEFQAEVENLGSYANYLGPEEYQAHLDELDAAMASLAEEMQNF